MHKKVLYITNSLAGLTPHWKDPLEQLDTTLTLKREHSIDCLPQYYQCSLQAVVCSLSSEFNNGAKHNPHKKGSMKFRMYAYQEAIDAIKAFRKHNNATIIVYSMAPESLLKHLKDSLIISDYVRNTMDEYCKRALLRSIHQHTFTEKRA